MVTNVDQMRTKEKIDGHPQAQGRGPQDGTSLPAPSHHACRAVRTTFPLNHLWSSAACYGGPCRAAEGAVGDSSFLLWILGRSWVSLVSGSCFSSRLSAFPCSLFVHLICPFFRDLRQCATFCD